MASLMRAAAAAFGSPALWCDVAGRHVVVRSPAVGLVRERVSAEWAAAFPFVVWDGRFSVRRYATEAAALHAAMFGA